MNPATASLVTYVIPTYNHAHYLQEAIESLVKQTYDNIELIIINDGSTDDTEQVVEKIKNKCLNRFVRFKFVSRTNKGIVRSLNEGLEWSKGEFFSMLASDDVLLPNKTSLMVELLSNASRQIVAGFAGMEIINSNSKSVGNFLPNAGVYDFEDIFLKRAPYSAPTQMIRTKALKSLGGYDEELKFEDWAILLDLTFGGSQIQVITDVVAKYRRHSTNISKQIINNHAYRMKVLQKFRHHELFNEASARVLAGHASEIASIDHKKAFSSLILAIAHNRRIIFDKKFIRGSSDTIKAKIKALFK